MDLTVTIISLLVLFAILAQIPWPVWLVIIPLLIIIGAIKK